MDRANVWTIGFTQTSAQHFFDRLTKAGVKKLLDVRLHNSSQLSGFAKADDLAWFLTRIGNIKYDHQPPLAPTEELLSAYRKKTLNWEEYERRFLALMAERKIEERFYPTQFEGACLLCSEAKPHHCHRRLVCEYLNARWDNVLQVHHL